MGYRTLTLEEIRELDQVEIFVRDPWERFLSGVQTFLDFNPELDKKTALWFINEYLFLNRHFCPQLYWVINLGRFIRPDTKIKISHVRDLAEITQHNHNPVPKKDDVQGLENDLARMYLKLDTILTQRLLNKSVRLATILAGAKFEHPEIYEEVFIRSHKLCAALDIITS
jgi:hypothetical protein